MNAFFGRSARLAWRWLACLALASAWAPADAQQRAPGPRIALIIANGDYLAPKDRLSGPLSDAVAVREALQAGAFTGVDGDRGPSLLANGTRAQMRQKLEAFKAALKDAGPLAIGVLYYAGHGGSDAAGNENYILPVDIPDVATAPIAAHGIGVRWITEELLGEIDADRRPTIVVVIDACRTPQGTPGADGRGAAPVHPMVKPDNDVPLNMLVALSTGPGQTAPDAGVYAKVLASKIKDSPGTTLAALFDDVMVDVAHRTGQAQIPVQQSKIVAKVCLAVCGSHGQADAWPTLKAAMDVRAAGDMGQVAAIGSLVRDKRSFAGLEFRGLFLAGAMLDGADFEGSDLTAANLEGARLSGARLASADLRFTTLGKMRSEGAGDATRARFHFALADGAQFAGWTAPRSTWAGASLRAADFHGARLAGANFSLSDLRDADFRGADLQGAFFEGALVSGARFDGANLADADFTGVVGDARQFTPQQQSGLCGRIVGRGTRLLVREVSHNAQSSTGLRFDTVVDEWIGVVDGLKLLDACDERELELYGPRSVDDYGYQYVGDFRVDLPAPLLEQAHRGDALFERVRAMVKRLNEAYKTGPFVRVFGKKQARFLAAVKANARETRLETAPELEPESARLLALRYEPAADAYYKGWESMAEEWSGSEVSRLKDRKQYPNQWHAFYPPGSTSSQLTPEVVEVFKQWTLGRAAAYPQRITLRLPDIQSLRVPLWRAAAVKDAAESEVVFKPLWSHLESEPYPASMREFVRPDRHCLPLWTEGERSVVLRLPKDVDAYEVRLARSRLVPHNSRAIGVEVQLRVRGSQIVKRGTQSAQFIDVDVEGVQLLGDDGKPI